MIRMKKKLRLIGMVLLIVCFQSAWGEDFKLVTPEAAGFDSGELERLRGVADQLYEDGRIPNYVIALYKDGQNFYQTTRGKTSLEQGVPVDSDTIFHMASMSKPMVTTAAFILIQEKKLALSDPLSKFFPQFSQMMVAPGGDFGNQFEAAEREITILDLITHTSGFSYSQAIAGFGDVGQLYDELGIFSDRSVSTIDHLNNLAEIPLVAQPGTQFNYSVSVDVLGSVIEQVAKMDLASYLAQVLFEPLGMSQSQFVISEAQVSKMSNIFGSLPFNPTVKFKTIGKVNPDPDAIDWKIGEVLPVSVFTQEPAFYSGGGGILSTANDYATYLSMVANGGTWGGVEILKPELAAMHSKSLVPTLTGDAFRRVFGDAADFMTFGGGFGVKKEPDDTTKIDYIFWAGAFNTFFWIDPNDGSIGLFLTAHWPVQYNISDSLEQIVDEARL